MQPTRRIFVASSFGAALAASVRGESATGTPCALDSPWPGFPKQHVELVREVVGASHRNEERVRELVGQHPGLVNAWYDWGFGDWESPLGAAAHTGRRSIALFLIERGARIDMFAAAMLGQLDTVKALLDANPGAARTLGPHGIPLLAHATAGGDEAASTAAFLAAVPGAGDGIAVLPLENPERYIGGYAFKGGRLEVTFERERLSIMAADKGMRNLHRVGEHEFFPAGVPSVRVRFECADGLAAALTITDHDLVVRASRAS